MSLLGQLSKDLETLVSRSAPAVVLVEHRRGQGTGMVLSQDSYILTNFHVVESPKQLQVGLATGDEIEAELVGADERTDLAVLRIDWADLKILPLAENKDLVVGQLVVAIGNPLRFKRSVSLGVISALDRSLSGPDGMLLEGLIQTDAAINPGNFGGPLVNAEGAVVGINTAMIPYAQGIGFAVPAQTAGWVAGELIRKGVVKRPYLGIQAAGHELDDVRARATGQGRAVRIHRVEPATPADRGGLQAEDLVLTANGKAVGCVDDIQRVMVLEDAREVQFHVLRGWARHDLVIKPAHPRPVLG